MRNYKAYGFSEAETRLLELLESISPERDFIEPIFLMLVSNDEDADAVYNAIKESGMTDPYEILETILEAFSTDERDE